MPSKTNNLQRCASYADAESLFKLPAPRGKLWGEHLRRLGSGAQYHYRVEKCRDDSYAVILYQTVMARFHKPDASGARRVVYQWDNRPTSTGFLWHVLRVQETMHYPTLDGRRVAVTLHAGITDLTFVEDKLDVSRSDHTPQYKWVMSDADKGRRTHWREVLQPLVQMAVIRHKDVAFMPPHSRWEDKRMFGPFTGINTAWALKMALKEYDVDSHEFIDALMDCAEDVIYYAKGRAHYEERPEPSSKQLEDAVMRFVFKWRGLDARNECVELPKFPEVK